jgi:hypothetical protein
MLSASDLEKHSLSSLYELMSLKIDELKAVQNLSGPHKDLDEIKSDIELIQDVINAKKIIAFNKKNM